MDDLTPVDAIIIEIGCPQWRRWMIYHRSRDCYWFKGRWQRRRRDGEVWNVMAEARAEIEYARINWQEIVIEDEDDE